MKLLGFALAPVLITCLVSSLVAEKSTVIAGFVIVTTIALLAGFVSGVQEEE